MLGGFSVFMRILQKETKGAKFVRINPSRLSVGYGSQGALKPKLCRSRLEANPWFLGWRRRSRWVDNIHHALQDCHDNGFVNIQAFLQIFFQRGEFLSEIAPI